MDVAAFEKSPAGRLVKTLQSYSAFVPNPLPPKLSYTKTLIGMLSEADRSLATLEGVGRRLPNPQLLVGPYVRREAVLSSRIEGTLASLSDLFLFETEDPEEPRQPDVREVHNYVRALSRGLERLDEIPLSLRLARELHRELVRGVRGWHGKPGEIRKEQNWIGPPGCSLDEATYVPPPTNQLPEALNGWEKFLHVRDLQWPPLIQCGLLHYQFEAIHPFIDGNGRVGRLLIILFLRERGLLTQPLLSLSVFFERHRAEYYDRLQAVSSRGDWEGWLTFFLTGVAFQSKDALTTSENILALHEKYRKTLQKQRVTAPALALVDEVFLNPYITIPRARDKLRVSYPTAQAAVNKLVKAGILKELTTRHRNRIYFAQELLQLVEGRGSRRNPGQPVLSKQ